MFMDTVHKKIDSPKDNGPGLNFLLKELADDDNFYSVCRALQHGDHEISIGASLALGHLKDDRALPFLLRAVLTTDSKRAEAVIWALGEIGDEAALPYLLTALRARFVPKSALLALGKIGSPEILDGILLSLEDDDETVRLLSAKALLQIRFQHDVTLITKASHAINSRLAHETSRRVKLILSVNKSRLLKAVD